MAVDFLLVSKVLSSLTCSSPLSSSYSNFVPNMLSATIWKWNLNRKITPPLVQGFWIAQRSDNCAWTVKVCWTRGQGTDWLDCVQTARRMLGQQIPGLCTSSLSELQVPSSIRVPRAHRTPHLCVTGHGHPHSLLRFPSKGEEGRRNLMRYLPWESRRRDPGGQAVWRNSKISGISPVLAQFSHTSVYALSQAG